MDGWRFAVLVAGSPKNWMVDMKNIVNIDIYIYIYMSYYIYICNMYSYIYIYIYFVVLVVMLKTCLMIWTKSSYTSHQFKISAHCHLRSLDCSVLDELGLQWFEVEPSWTSRSPPRRNFVGGLAVGFLLNIVWSLGYGWKAVPKTSENHTDSFHENIYTS